MFPASPRPRRRASTACVAAVLLLAGGRRIPALDAPFRFVDRGREAGLVHATLCGGPAKQHLMASGGSGAALFDYDGDGLLDVYLVNSWSFGDGRILEKPPHRLYRNLGGLLAGEGKTDGDDGLQLTHGGA